MDAFEQIVGKLLEEDGFWVRHSVKIDLTKEDKIAIGNRYTPRPEIDIIAYNVKNNELILVEVKSYFDSKGVQLDEVKNLNENQEGRFKIFTSVNYRNTLTKRLKSNWVESGIIKQDTIIKYALVAGKIYKKTENDFKKYFNENGWIFYSPDDVKTKIKALSKKGYENHPVTISAKILK